MATLLVAACFLICLFYKNLSQKKNKFDFQMSHMLQNTRALNSSNEIEKINNRGVARTTASI